MSVKGRTVREFVAGPEVWEKVDRWAESTGYRLMEQDQYSRLYQRGTGLLVAPQRLKISYTGSGYRLEAWAHVPHINRLLSFGLMPAELMLESSGGLMGYFPRKKAREQVNLLLQELGLPLID